MSDKRDALCACGHTRGDHLITHFQQYCTVTGCPCVKYREIEQEKPSDADQSEDRPNELT